jgi:electron transport complex protein RnfG
MKEILRLCFVLTIIAAVSAGVLAFVDQQTEKPIAQSLREETMAAVRSVLPAFDNEPDKDTVVLAIPGSDSVTFYRGRKEGEIVGVAFAVVAPNGYSGEIKIMMGLRTDGVVTGIEILKHLETPGLGAKIETALFRDQYKGKSISDPEVWDVMKDGGTFKQITGATISSRAVTHAVARGIESFLESRDDIIGAGKKGPDRGRQKGQGHGRRTGPDTTGGCGVDPYQASGDTAKPDDGTKEKEQ